MKHWLLVWLKLIKPRVTSLVLVTALPGLYLGLENISGSLVFWTLFGTFLMSSASFVFNQVIEKDRDAQMDRTKNRPIPKGDISPAGAFAGGILLVIASFAVFYLKVNLLSFYCAFAALIAYVFLYTIYLKPRTEQNIVIGGVAGCVGPLIGYAASSDSLPLPAWILFGMIFLWTPAHFWALAIFLEKDYDTANFPMFPVIHGKEKTARSIFVYTLLYSASCIGFYFSTLQVGSFYLISTLILCIYMIYLSWKLVKNTEEKAAKSFFFFSIFHLFLVNFIILADFAVQSKRII